MNDRVRVGLLFGGRSVEHEVSVVSARSVASAIRKGGMECVPLGVTGAGRWLSPELSSRLLERELARVETTRDLDDGARMLIDPGGSGLLRLAADGSVRPVSLDVLFPLIHGWGGEDGRVQGALELAEIPYVGAGVLGSAAGMDKAVSKQLFVREGLTVVPWLVCTRDEWRSGSVGFCERVREQLGYPAFVKPCNGGSSVGISRVDRDGQLDEAMETALALDRRVVVERGIDAREVECAVLGNDRPEASGLGEIEPSREFYDYEAKYVDGTSRLRIPAPVDDATEARLRKHAIRAYRALDLRGFARVDFLLDRETGTGYINEVNTLPGFTPISMFPKLWEAAGLSYPGLVARLVELAREAARDEASRRTRRTED